MYCLLVVVFASVSFVVVLFGVCCLLDIGCRLWALGCCCVAMMLWLLVVVCRLAVVVG